MLTYLLYSDINECEDTLVTVNCTQNCINTFGSYECVCYDGYQATSVNDSIQCMGMYIFNDLLCN